MKLSLYFCLFLLFTSCAQLGLKYTESKINIPKDKSIVTIYRPWSFVGSAGDPFTCLDYKAVGEFYNGAYFNIELVPGSHTIGVGSFGGQSENSITFNVVSGQHYYLRFDISKLNGAKEATQAAGMAGAGAIGYLMSGAFFSKDKPDKINEIVDKRVQKEVINQGLYFISEKYALEELKDLKEYRVKEYKTDWCSEKTK